MNSRVTRLRPYCLLLLSSLVLSACVESVTKPSPPPVVAAVTVEKLATALMRGRFVDAASHPLENTALTEALTALNNGVDSLGARAALQSAFFELEQGHALKAKALLADYAGKRQAEPKQAAAALSQLAALAVIDDPAQAVAAYRRAASLDPENLDILERLGQAQLQADAYQGALTTFQQLLALTQARPERALTAAAYGYLAQTYRLREQWEQALAMQNKALTIYQALHDQQKIADSLAALGRLYQARGDFDKANDSLNKSLRMNQALANQPAIAQNYADLGASYYRLYSQLPVALAYYQKALQTSAGINDLEAMAKQYGNLGDTYQKQGDFANTVAMYQKALQIYRQLASNPGMALFSRNLGVVYRNHQQFSQAVAMLQQALQWDQQAGNRDGLAYDYNHLGLAYQLQGNKAEAKRNYVAAIELMRQLNHDEDAENIQDLLDGL